MDLRAVHEAGGAPRGSGWEWADPDLALDLALMVSRPIYEATGRPIFKKPVALLAQWVSRVGPNSSSYLVSQVIRYVNFYLKNKSDMSIKKR